MSDATTVADFDSPEEAARRQQVHYHEAQVCVDYRYVARAFPRGSMHWLLRCQCIGLPVGVTTTCDNWAPLGPLGPLPEEA